MKASEIEDVVRLRQLGLKYAEIAAELNMSLDQVKRRYYAADDHKNTTPFVASPSIVNTTSSPKILFFDIETAPVRGWVWRAYEDNLIKTDHDWYMLSFAYQWAHEDEIRVCALPDYPGFRKDVECDHALLKDLWKLFDEADIIIAHNGDAFDIKKSNARFIIHEFTPPSTYKTIDTLKIARKYFKFTSNKLNDLGNFLDLGEKLPHTGAHLWFGCMNGDLAAWELMKQYNIQDVRLLAKVYYRMAPWHLTHPNLNVYTGEERCCPKCQSPSLIKKGFWYQGKTKRQQYVCKNCGGWTSLGGQIKQMICEEV